MRLLKLIIVDVLERHTTLSLWDTVKQRNTIPIRCDKCMTVANKRLMRHFAFEDYSPVLSKIHFTPKIRVLTTSARYKQWPFTLRIADMRKDHSITENIGICSCI